MTVQRHHFLSTGSIPVDTPILFLQAQVLESGPYVTHKRYAPINRLPRHRAG